MKILLANLPFGRKIQRDFGCPHTVKADYYWPPVDLLAFGAILNGIAELEYLDSIIISMKREQFIDEVIRINPDHIFAVTSSITLKDDLAVFSELKNLLPEVKIWATGDVIFFEDKIYEGIDFHVRDFTNKRAILDLFVGNAATGVVEHDPSPEYSIGICPHEIVMKYCYAMPYSLYAPVSIALTNYGCPFKCKFCNSNKLTFKKRNLNEIIADLKHGQNVGIKEFFFRDFTFGIPQIEQLCDEIINKGINIRWSCEIRVDVVDEPTLKKMKTSGCYLIFYGVETGTDEVLANMNKGFTISKVKESIKKTNALGIETLLSFIFGLPGEDIEATTDLIFDLDPDYVSINLFVPRVGSVIRNEMRIDDNAYNTDSLFSSSVLIKKRNSVERRFFFGPSKLARYLYLATKSPFRIKIFLKNAFGLLKRSFVNASV